MALKLVDSSPPKLQVGPRRTHVAPSWTPPRTPPGWNQGGSTKSALDSERLHVGPTQVQLSPVDSRSPILADSIREVHPTLSGLDSTGLGGGYASDLKSDVFISDFYESLQRIQLWQTLQRTPQ